MEQPPFRALLRRRAVLVGIPALAGTGLLVYAALAGSSRPALTNRPELQELVAAVGERRLFEPRLTGNFAYGHPPVDTTTRAGERTAEEAPLAVRMAAIALEKRARDSTDPVTLNAFGIAQLATGHTARAVATLEDANRLAPRSARISSDLAAAYLVRARQMAHIEDVARAVGYAQQAVAVEPALPEAHFNLALSLEGLSLRHQAARAWDSYLRLDPASPWAAEARARRDRLAETPEMRWERQRRDVLAAAERADAQAIRAVTERLPDAAYDHVENDLIPAWADAWLTRDGHAAARNLRLARLFGQALADHIGDRMALDAVTVIERAMGGGPRADALAHAHREFREGRALLDQDRIGAADERFLEARGAFSGAQSSFDAWITLYLAVSAYYRGELDRSAGMLEPLTRTAAVRRHFVLGGRAERVRGLIYNLTSQPADALDRYQSAFSYFSRAGIREEVASIHAILAETYEQCGDYRTAWSHWKLALEGVSVLRTARRRQTTLNAAAIAMQQVRLLGAALQIRHELVTDTLGTRRAGAIVAAFIGRAEVHRRLGEQALAAADVRAAEDWLSRIGDPALAERERAETRLVEGEILLESQPARAVAALHESLEYFTRTRMSRRIPRVALALGRAHQNAGNSQAAEDSFRRGIAELERYRSELPRSELRLTYFEQPWNIFDELVALQVARGESMQALTVAERARARDLLDRESRSASTPVVDPSLLAGSLPRDTVMLYFASLERELLIWVIGSGGIELVRQPAPAAEIARKVASFHEALQGGHGGQMLRQQSAHLFDEVIGPVRRYLPVAGRLVVVPDGALHRLPFAALNDPVSGRFLVEDHAIAVAPSAAMFLRASRGLRRLRASSSHRVLAIGNPLLDPAEGASMPNLPGAADEARDLAALYRDARVLTGAQATRRAFLDNAGAFDIVHFGGHALANERYPMMSRLLLARDGDGRSGSLFAQDLVDRTFPRTGLLVLAACRSAAGPIVKGEGPISVARPFLAAGIPSVVATLWDVGDAPSLAFFAVFYRSLRSGNQPADALRAAQLNLLRGEEPAHREPRAWAAFVAMGGMELNGGQR